MKKVWNIISGAVVAVVVFVAAILLLGKVFGAGTYAVLSGSMEPIYPVGSLIVTQKVDVNKLQVGDSITFSISSDTVVTHRITKVEKNEGQLEFRTKGDANAYEDAKAVNYRNVIGKPLFAIPFLGYIISYIQQPPGTFVVIGFVAILLIGSFLIPEESNEKEVECDS